MSDSRWVALVAFCALAGCTPFDPAGDVLPPDEAAALETEAVTLEPGDGSEGEGVDDAATVEEPPDDWACLADVESMSALVNPAGEGRRWVYSTRLLSLSTGEPMAGATARACPRADVTCAAPAGSTYVSDEDGWVDVPITEGFNGYFEFVRDDLVPAMVFYEDLREDRASLDNPIAMVELEVFPALSVAAGLEPDPSTGLIAVRVFNCAGEPSPGVVIEHDRGGSAWYYANGLPSTEADATAAEGLGGFSNVAPGVSVLSTYLTDGTPLSVDQSVLVRPSWLTSLVTDPSRRQ